MKTELPTVPDANVWFYTDEKQTEAITQELRKEVGPKHPLYHLSERLVIIARCGTNDDVLARDSEDHGRVFCVHLTWAGKYDQIPTNFPSFEKIKEGDLAQFFASY